MVDRKRRLDCANGIRKADIVLKHGKVLNVFTEEILEADVAICGDTIVGVGSYAVSYTHLDVYKRQVQSNELLAYVDAMPKWSEIFKDSDIQTKQMILSTLIDKIIVKDDDITIKFKIRLDDFLDEKLLENDSPDVPQQRLQLYDHVLHGI